MREAWISISATRPVDLRLARHQPGEDAAEAQGVLAQLRAHPVVAGRRRVALVEDQVDDLEHGRQARARSSAPCGDLERNARVGERLLGPDDALRDRRLAARGTRARSRASSGRRAAAASAPPAPRSTSTGWQPVKISASRSSPIVVDLRADVRREPTPSSRASSSCLSLERLERRMRSIARCLAVAISQAPGLSGTPDSGHCSSAATSASCARSSARPTSRSIRARPAIRRAGLDPPDRLDRALGRRPSVTLAVCCGGSARASPPPGRPRASLDLDHLANLDDVALSSGSASPTRGLSAVLGLDDPVAADELLGLGERAVGDVALPPQPICVMPASWACRPSTGEDERPPYIISSL